MASGVINKPTKLFNLPSVTANQSISLPDSFSVLFVYVGLYSIHYEFCIPYSHLTSTAKNFRLGQYKNSTDWSRATISVSLSSVSVADFDINGTDYKSNAELLVAYLP